MAAAYCYEGIPMIFLASLFDIQMRYLVYMRYLWFKQFEKITPQWIVLFILRSNGPVVLLYAYLRQFGVGHQ